MPMGVMAHGSWLYFLGKSGEYGKAQVNLLVILHLKYIDTFKLNFTIFTILLDLQDKH